MSLDAPSGEPPRTDLLWTIPNLLCAIRLAGTLPLLVLAWFEQTIWFIVLFLLLFATDLIDGRIARWLRQFSSLGARLDSVADIALFAALLIGSALLVPEYLVQECLWIAAPIAAYAVSCLAALIKFRRPPTYHTRLAKLSTYLVVLSSILVLAGVSPWPLRCTLLLVTLVNIEATAITFVLPRWQTDVISLRRAISIARRERDCL
jgi:CDP-diacylglycerol--glycerol-3-phosphate 3-phosphatidyltransferase